MYLKHKTSQNMVEILNIQALFDPCRMEVSGRFHAGEELQEPDDFDKDELVFPSDEVLPQCWLNPDYRHQH